MGYINDKLTASEFFIKVTGTFEVGRTYTKAEVDSSCKQHGWNLTPIFPSDYCYNCTNNGIDFTNRTHRLFHRAGRGKYVYYGSRYPYSGIVTHTNINHKTEVIGEWKCGKYLPDNDAGCSSGKAKLDKKELPD